MTYYFKTALFFVLSFWAGSTFAYLEDLHEKLSTEAFKKTWFFDTSRANASLGVLYSDSFPNSEGDSKDVLNLVGFGAWNEDQEKRSLAHFYNPQWGAGFKGGIYGFFPNSKEWIIDGTTGDGPVDRLIGFAMPSQRFSYENARDYQLMSLTSPDSSVRRGNMGMLFQSLGHIVHHIQDMGQPQHVRDDMHCHLGESVVGTGLDGCKELEIALKGITVATAPVPIGIYVASQVHVHEKSAYEEFSYKRLSKNNFSRLSDLLGSQYSSRLFSENRVFALPGDYWENPQGTGMAEFTSKNFVSVETDFNIAETPGDINIGPLSAGPFFSIPKPHPVTDLLAKVVAERIENVIAEDPVLSNELPNPGLTGDIYFVKASVFDPLTATFETVNRMSAFSVFNEKLSENGKEKVVTQNFFTYDSRMKVLIPRAVALSSGFMEYFFRGSLAIAELASRRSGSSWYWDIQLKNISAEPMSGSVELYYDDASGRRHVFSSINNLTLAPGASSNGYSLLMPAEITLPTDVVAVFHGQLGAESKNVSSVIKQVTPPEVPAIPCGQALSADGGSAGYSRTSHVLGNVSGRVQVEFEAYSIPDQIIVRRPDGNILVQTAGKVSGYYNNLWFDHNPAEYGNDVTVEVIANADPGTKWTFTMGCPGQTISNADRTIDQKMVAFSYGCSDAGCVYCSGDFYLDGIKKFSFGGIGNAVLGVIPGPHSYKYGNVQCNTTPQCSSYSFKFTDSAGTHSLSSPVVDSNGGPLNIQ